MTQVVVHLYFLNSSVPRKYDDEGRLYASTKYHFSVTISSSVGPAQGRSCNPFEQLRCSTAHITPTKPATGIVNCNMTGNVKKVGRWCLLHSIIGY